MTAGAHRTENIVYSVRTDGCPAIGYRAIPSDCAGAANTLAEARSSYRSQLTTLLQVDRRGLPPVVEHIEATVHGLRVREQIGTVHRDHHADRMLLQTLLAGGVAQDELRAYVEQTADRGIDPVVLLAEPDEPVAAVLDQMTACDTVVVTFSSPDTELDWAAIHGPEAHCDNGIPTVSDATALRDVPVDELTRHFGIRAVRVSPQILPQAC